MKIDDEIIRNRMERDAIHKLQETLYDEVLPLVPAMDNPECRERILDALVAFQEELEAISLN